MSKINWDEIGKRRYETGVSHGVLYPMTDGKYDAGVPWNGLSSFQNSPSGAEESKIYADNMKYLSLYSAEEYGATLEAYDYPDEFEPCNGTAELAPGVTVGQQTRKPFGFSYQSLIGNDTKGTKYGYKIHIIYNAMAQPSEKQYQTVNDSPEAMTLSWTLTTTPVNIPGADPSAHLEIDSTKVDATILKKIEDTLYGTDDAEPTLPTPEELIAMLKSA